MLLNKSRIGVGRMYLLPRDVIVVAVAIISRPSTLGGYWRGLFHQMRRHLVQSGAPSSFFHSFFVIFECPAIAAILLFGRLVVLFHSIRRHSNHRRTLTTRSSSIVIIVASHHERQRQSGQDSSRRIVRRWNLLR